MKRKQIYLEDAQDIALKRLAANRGQSEAALIREALQVFLAEEDAGGYDRMEDSPLWGLVGLLADSKAPEDSSLNHDHYIYGTPKKYRIRDDGMVERNKQDQP
jgi:hypothetical protein